MADVLDAITRRTTAFFALLGAIGVFAMLVHICAYVIGRHVASAPVPATVEIVSNYYMILIAFLPLAWAERRGDMVSVEILGQLLKGRFKTINAVFVTLVTAGAYAILTYTTWIVATKQFATKTYVISLSMTIPIWPAYFILPLSFGLATLVCLLRLPSILAGKEHDGGHAPEEEYRE